MFKNNLSVIIIFLLSNSLFTQTIAQYNNVHSFGISTGLGISVIHLPDITDYINSISTINHRIDDFGIAAEFFGAPEIKLNDKLGLKIEYAYLIKSYEIQSTITEVRQIIYDMHLPTFIGHYLIEGENYVFKLGGGLGYHYAKVTREFIYPGSHSLTSVGIGLKIEIEGNTKFDEHFFGYISFDARNNFMKKLKDKNNKTLQIYNSNKDVESSFFSLGFKLGIIYYFF